MTLFLLLIFEFAVNLFQILSLLSTGACGFELAVLRGRVHFDKGITINAGFLARNLQIELF